MKITEGWKKEKIRSAMPEFDFSKDYSQAEVRHALSTADKILASRRSDEGSRHTTEVLSIKPGMAMLNDEGERLIVKSICKNGHLRMEGRRGSFNPLYLKKTR